MNYLEIEDHIDCCGIKHVYGFFDPDTWEEYYYTDEVPPKSAYLEDLDECLKTITNEVRFGEKGQGLLVEITLTDKQLNWKYFLRKALRERGFKKVSSFINKNTSNKVNVYHLVITK